VYGRNLAARVCWTMTTEPTFGAEFKPGEGGTKEGERAPSPWHAGSTLGGRGEKRPWSKIATATVAA